MDKKLLIILSLMFFPCFSFSENLMVPPPEEKFFDDPKTPSAYEVFAKEINEVENYLNNYSSLTATFKQSNKEGNIRYGKIFISKPGKIRCEYLPPSPILLVIKDTRLVLYDYNLDEISYADSEINSLNFLAKQNINFHEVGLMEIEKSEKYIEFTIKEQIKNSDQILLLTLKFTYPNISLKQINILSEGSDINLILDNIKYNQLLGKELFSLNRDILKKNKK